MLEEHRTAVDITSSRANFVPATGPRSHAQVLSVTELCKAYGTTVALKDVELSIDEGEVLGLLGPNGAGKTTTIACIAGLTRPDCGTVSICGVDALRCGETARRHLGLATQRNGLYGPLTVEDNLRFFAAVAGATGKRLANDIRTTIMQFELAALCKRVVDTLSPGEQRLVHIAGAVIGAPRLVLLDEATAYLDVNARQLVYRAVNDLALRGRAILYSSHHLDEIEMLCTRAVIMHRGAVIAQGGVRHLIRRFAAGDTSTSSELSAPSRGRGAAGTMDVPQAPRLEPTLESLLIELTSERTDDRGTEGAGAR
jgi:ABC-type multidrug transport system ATPase subunit